MANEDYTAMAKEDYREYHQQLAARLRSAAEHSTTKAIKARLVAEAEQHERIVRGETEIRAESPPISSAPSDKPQAKERESVAATAPSSSRLKPAEEKGNA
jgi:predicted RNA polymerase sigma factor